MNMQILPIVFTTREDKRFLEQLESRIRKNRSAAEAELLLHYPIVYIHYWQTGSLSFEDKEGIPHSYNKYDVYVGESNNVIHRTKEHYDCGQMQDNWQYNLANAHCKPQMVVIGHEHFNKSLTLDVENRLIEYIVSMDSVEHLYNGRGNPQNNYYPSDEFNDIFHKIWSRLRTIDNKLFLSETEVKDSAIFKASPFKKLTEEQVDAKNAIIRTIRKAINKEPGQLVFVQGEAGTGKTVLTTSIFYELVQLSDQEDLHGLDCHLMVNHNEQLTVYEQLVKRLNLDEKKASVSKPTTFINAHKPSEKVDVSFVDEGHLMLTLANQGYQGHNQLQDIMDRSKVTVVMFDEYQILTTEQYWEADLLERYKKLSKRQDNFIELKHQLRMKCAPTTIKWLDDFILKKTVTPFEPDDEYEVKLFDTPAALHSAIKEKASTEENRLSRVVASYDWAYSSIHRPADGGYWGVRIDDWFLPWNYELLPTLSKKEKRRIDSLAWAEQPQTMNEAGSTFTIQGFDLSYVGVILGPSVKYRNGTIVIDPSESKSRKATRNRTLEDGTRQKFGELLIRNEIKVLMTRGVKGLYIYAVDEELRKALKTIAKI